MVTLVIYPPRRVGGERPNEIIPLLEAFDALQSFVAATAKGGGAAIVYLT